MNRSTFVHLLLLLSVLSGNVVCQSKNPNDIIDPAYLEGMEYRFAGPTRGGRATAVTGVADKPFLFYMGATGGGVWQTDDAGTSWKNISDGQIKTGSIGAIAVAPANRNIIYVGTGSACARGNVSPGIGMYKSIDAGKTWEHIGLPQAGQIGKIEIHPQNPDIAYVAALGQIFGPNKERGVYRTMDGGKSWEQVLFVSDSTGAIDLAMNMDNPREIYAAMWRAERKPWTMIDGGRQGGIWKTMNGGNTWTKLEGGLPTGLLGKIGLAISPANPNRIWAIILAAEEEDAGLYRSDDAGKSWSRICRDHKLRQRGWYYAHITAHPTDENTVFVNNVDFFKSIDGGNTFSEEISSPHGDNHGLWINPTLTDVMIQCNDGGACVTLNGGKSWTDQLNQPTSEFYRVTVDNQFPYRLYAGQQDNTSISVPSHDPGGITDTENWFDAGGSESADVGVNHHNPDIIWAGSYSGEISILNRGTGQIREVTAYPHYTEGTRQRDLKYRWQWNFPIVVSSYNPDVVYHAGNIVFKTTNNGQTWEKISPDLTRKLDQYHDIPGGPIQHDGTGVEIYSTVFALEESPHQEGELWAGTDDGLVHITKDGGKSWTDITPKGLPYECTINKIELSTHAQGRAFIAVHNYRYNDFKPYVLRTNNYGQSWELLTNGKNGIPENHFVRAIAEDPDRKGLLFAGTEFGLYVSFDDGVHWQSFQNNLPHVPITDIEIHEKDLVMSTQGRAFWVLDDLTPLHQVTMEVAQKEKFLFQSRPAYRTTISGFRPLINFYIKDAPSPDEKIQLEIFDDQNRLIRVYNNKSKNRLNKIKIEKGLNRFTWDLRHSGPELVSNLVTMVIGNPAPGPFAVPGKYTAKLTIGNWNATTPVEVLPDPRWTDVTPEAYKEQLEMCLEIREIISISQKCIENIRAVKEQMASISEYSQIKEVEDLSKQLQEQLTSVEDQLIQNKAEVSQDNINYPRVFSNRIGRLYSVVVQSHNRPTDGAKERFEDLKVLYKNIREAYDQVMKHTISTFNQIISEKNINNLIIPQKL